jgi:hypothetical protein
MVWLEMVFAARISVTLTLKRMDISHNVSPLWTIYTGPEGGVAVCAEAGMAEKSTIKTKKQAIVFLIISELNPFADLEFIQSIRVNLQDVSGWLVGCIHRTPGACQDAIHDAVFGIDPDDRQVHKNKEHMDGSIEPAVARLNQEQTLLMCQSGTEHQAPQPAKETIAIGCVDWRCESSVFIFDVDYFHN